MGRVLQLASFSLAEVTYATGDISYQVSQLTSHVHLSSDDVSPMVPSLDRLGNAGSGIRQARLVHRCVKVGERLGSCSPNIRGRPQPKRKRSVLEPELSFLSVSLTRVTYGHHFVPFYSFLYNRLHHDGSWERWTTGSEMPRNIRQSG